MRSHDEELGICFVKHCHECRLVRQYSNFFALKYVEKHVSLQKRTVSMVSLELCSSFAELAFVRDVSESSVKSAAVITRDTDVKISEKKTQSMFRSRICCFA